MDDKYNFVISKRAANDIENIYDYIFDILCNPIAANDLIDKLYESFKNLCLFPFSAEQLNNEFVKDKSIRKFLINRYIVFYRIKGKQIQIIRVLYGMRDYQSIL